MLGALALYAELPGVDDVFIDTIGPSLEGKPSGADLVRGD